MYCYISTLAPTLKDNSLEFESTGVGANTALLARLAPYRTVRTSTASGIIALSYGVPGTGSPYMHAINKCADDARPNFATRSLLAFSITIAIHTIPKWKSAPESAPTRGRRELLSGCAAVKRAYS